LVCGTSCLAGLGGGQAVAVSGLNVQARTLDKWTWT
jgi:hypothetical protein